MVRGGVCECTFDKFYLNFISLSSSALLLRFVRWCPCWGVGGPVVDCMLSLNPRGAGCRWIADDSCSSCRSGIFTSYSARDLILLVVDKPYYTRVFVVVYSKHIDSSQETCTYVELYGVAAITLYFLF